MKFTFKARTDAGEIREGIVDAVDNDTAVQILQRNGLIPVTLVGEQESSNVLTKGFGKIWQGVSQKELMVFFRQLATLIEARVPIVASLTTIAEQAGNDYFALLIQEMADDVEDGMSFS